MSNHPDMRQLVESFGIPFHHIPVTAETKAEAEKRQLEIVTGKDRHHRAGKVYANYFAEIH